MKFISLNCNGIRSASQKGFYDLIRDVSPDIVSLQEIKATSTQIDLEFWEKNGYSHYIFSAEKKGYSGTAVFSKIKPDKVSYGLNEKSFDIEGRNILLCFDKFTLVNTYFPSGTSGEERQKLKMKFLDFYYKKLIEWMQEYKKLIICGDFNIAHKEIDIHDPKRNAKNSGFLPEEREWLDLVFQSGLLDTFRYQNPDAKDMYSWWTYRSNARENNKGWRIDYFIVTENLKKFIVSSKIMKNFILSDHAPLLLELNV